MDKKLWEKMLHKNTLNESIQGAILNTITDLIDKIERSKGSLDDKTINEYVSTLKKMWNKIRKSKF